MIPLSLGSLGEQIDLIIRQGGTFGPMAVTMLNPSGTPVNLTDCTIASQIRRSGLSPTVAASMSVTIATDPTTGQFTFGLSAASTAALQCGQRLEDALSLYVWDMTLTDGLGNVLPLYYGYVRVFREVTQ